MREIALQRGERDLGGFDDGRPIDGAGHPGKRDMDGERDHTQFAADQHHHGARRARQLARKSVCPGNPKPACISTALLIGAVTTRMPCPSASSRRRG